MEKKTKENFFLIFLAIIIIAGIVGYLTWNEPHRDIKNAAALKTTAVLLYSYLTKDSAIMKSKFINKVVEVTGEVKQISKNQNGAQIILLRSNLPDGSFILLNNQPFLILNRQAFVWSPSGYDKGIALHGNDPLTILTPRSVVNMFKAGYVTQLALTN